MVALAAVSRGDALRLIDAVPDLDVMVVGKPSEKGDLNDQPKPATLLGQGLTLPFLLRRLKLMDDGSEEREESLARAVAGVAGLREVERLRTHWNDHKPLLEDLLFSASAARSSSSSL